MLEPERLNDNDDCESEDNWELDSWEPYVWKLDNWELEGTGFPALDNEKFVGWMVKKRVERLREQDLEIWASEMAYEPYGDNDRIQAGNLFRSSFR